MIVLIAIIAIILVKVNSSNVKNKEVKGIKPGTEAVKTKADTQTEDDSTTDKSGIEEFALFGVDSRSDQLDKGTRSDSIMVVRVDHDAKKIRMVSIFRDCKFISTLYSRPAGTCRPLLRRKAWMLPSETIFQSLPSRSVTR